MVITCTLPKIQIEQIKNGRLKKCKNAWRSTAVSAIFRLKPLSFSLLRPFFFFHGKKAPSYLFSLLPFPIYHNQVLICEEWWKFMKPIFRSILFKRGVGGGIFFPASLVFQFFHADFFLSYYFYFFPKKKSHLWSFWMVFGKWKVRLFFFYLLLAEKSHECDGYILWFFNLPPLSQNKKIFKKLSNAGGERRVWSSKNAVIYLFSHGFLFPLLYKYSLFWDKPNQYYPRLFSFFFFHLINKKHIK